MLQKLVEDSLAIQMMLQRLYLSNSPLTLAYKEFRGEFHVLAQGQDRFAVRMPLPLQGTWGLVAGEKVGLALDDRGFKFEGVVDYQAAAEVDGVQGAQLSLPRSLRRTDSHRVVDFVPDTTIQATFTNARNALLDGQVQAFGSEGFEVSLKDPKQNIQDYFRMGEEATLDLALGEGLRIMTPTKVAYFGEACVGLKFTDQSDEALLGRYRSWLEGQQRLQAQRDQEDFTTGGPVKGSKGPTLPGPKLWVDRDPMVLVLTEREDFLRRLSEGLGRKFGFVGLDYVKGQVQPLLAELTGEGGGWGRFKLILVHNQLKLASPLELTRQLTQQEHCPLPVVLVGTEEDESLKRNRALEAGGVDYVPVEPFKILGVLRRLDELIRMFE